MSLGCVWQLGGNYLGLGGSVLGSSLPAITTIGGENVESMWRVLYSLLCWSRMEVAMWRKCGGNVEAFVANVPRNEGCHGP